MRRALLNVALTAGVVLLLLVALTASVLIVGNTARGRLLMERMAERWTAGEVRLSGLAGSFPADLELARLELRDDQGIWLIAEGISLRWAPQALLARRLHVRGLRIARLDIERLPAARASGTGGGVNLPRIDADTVSVGRLELGQQLAGARVLLTLQASGHWVSPEDALVRFLASRINGVGTYELHLRVDSSHLDGGLTVEEEPGGPLENLLRLPGLGRLSIAAQLNGPPTAGRLLLTAHAGELNGYARGVIDIPARSADLDYGLRSPAMAPRADLAWHRMALSGRWHGPVSEPQAQGQLQIDQLQVPGGVSVSSLGANLNARGGALTARVDAAGLVLPGDHGTLLRESPLHLDATVQLGSPERELRLTATHRLFSLQARAVTRDNPNATFELHLPDLGPFAELAGQSARGSATLKGSIARVGATTRLVVGADADLPAGPAAWTRLLGRTPRLQLSGSLTGRTVEVERLSLTGSAVSLLADGRAERPAADASGAPAGTLRARWTLTLPNLNAVSPALAGDLGLTGQASGTFRSIATQMQATSRLSLRGSSLGTIRASFQARDLPAAASGSLQAQGTLDGAPLRLDARFDRDRERALRIAVTQTQWKSAHIEGDVTLASDPRRARGKLRLGVDQLSDLGHLLGIELGGSVAGNLALTQRRANTWMQLHLDAHNIVAQGVSGNARLIASGDLQAPRIELTVQLPELAGSAAALSAGAHLDLRARDLHLVELEASYRHQHLRMLSPAKVSFAQGLAVEGLKLGMGNAALELDGQVLPAPALRASVHGVDAALVNTFIPDLLAQGHVGAEAQLRGTYAAPEGQATLSAVGLRLANSAALNLPAIDIRGAAHLVGNASQLDVQLQASKALQLTLMGRAPLQQSGSFDLKLAGNLDLRLANMVLEPRGVRTSGTVTTNITVTGPAATPEIGGVIEITGGDLRDYARGVHLADITGRVTGSHGTLQITSLTAHAAPGEVTVTGEVGVLQPHVPVDLRLTARNATALTSDLLTARLDADLRLHGALRERLDATGTISVRRADINIPNTFPPNVAVLDVRRPGQKPPPVPPRPLTIGLDLALNAPRQILVRGRGLDAELGGQVRLRGTTANSRVSGGFDLIRGRFSLGSNSLSFTTGRVAFGNAGRNRRFDPTLDFTAVTTLADSTATLRVTGFADAPQFELSSVPPLPQDEILARLLFGQSASTLTAGQAAQLGAALTMLSGLGGELNILVRLQRTLGLDRLTVGTITMGSTTAQVIEAGRFVTERVYVGARENSVTGAQLVVDVDISRHLKITTRLGNNNASVQGVTPQNDPGSSIGVSYQFEY